MRLRFLALVALLLGAPAAAQLAPGYSGISSGPKEGTDNDYWYLIRQMGDCLVHTKGDQAAEVLSFAPNSPEEGKAVKALFGRTSNKCMRRFVRASFDRAHLRGSMAEALYRNRVRAMGGTTHNFAAPDKIANLYDFAACYVAKNYDEAEHLLANSRLATSEEEELVVQMSSGFSDCLPDRKVTLSAVEVRLALAEAMYRSTLPDEAAR